MTTTYLQIKLQAGNRRYLLEREGAFARATIYDRADARSEFIEGACEKFKGANRSDADLFWQAQHAAALHDLRQRFIAELDADGVDGRGDYASGVHWQASRSLDGTYHRIAAPAGAALCGGVHSRQQARRRVWQGQIHDKQGRCRAVLYGTTLDAAKTLLENFILSAHARAPASTAAQEVETIGGNEAYWKIDAGEDRFDADVLLNEADIKEAIIKEFFEHFQGDIEFDGIADQTFIVKLRKG